MSDTSSNGDFIIVPPPIPSPSKVNPPTTPGTDTVIPTPSNTPSPSLITPSPSPTQTPLPSKTTTPTIQPTVTPSATPTLLPTPTNTDVPGNTSFDGGLANNSNNRSDFQHKVNPMFLLTLLFPAALFLALLVYKRSRRKNDDGLDDIKPPEGNMRENKENVDYSTRISFPNFTNEGLPASNDMFATSKTAKSQRDMPVMPYKRPVNEIFETTRSSNSDDVSADITQNPALESPPAADKIWSLRARSMILSQPDSEQNSNDVSSTTTGENQSYYPEGVKSTYSIEPSIDFSQTMASTLTTEMGELLKQSRLTQFSNFTTKSNEALKEKLSYVHKKPQQNSNSWFTDDDSLKSRKSGNFNDSNNHQ